MVTKVKTKDNLTYKCDECGKSFKAEEVKLIKKAENFSIFGQIIRYVNKDGKPMRGDYDSIKETDRLLACPYCGKVHLFGFEIDLPLWRCMIF